MREQLFLKMQSLLLLHGANNDRPNYLLCWLAYQALTFFAFIGLAIYYCIIGPNDIYVTIATATFAIVLRKEYPYEYRIL